MKQTLVVAALAAIAAGADCPAYEQYARERNPPFSCGKYKFPYQRPSEECRSYAVPEVERILKSMKGKVRDPDLYRLFLNTWPSTVDTTVLWHGTSENDPEEEVSTDATECASSFILLIMAYVARIRHYWRHQCHVAAR